jgi:hypothetical protein
MIAVGGGVAILVVEETMLRAAEPTPRDCISAPTFNVRRPPPPALVPAGIRGFVTSPRLATFNAGADPSMFAFTFSGRVNAPPDRWRIEVDVLSTPDANPKDEAKWVNKVETFRATGGGPDVFTFLMDGIRPFASRPDAWTPGGLGRLRLVAVLDADPRLCAFLPALDSDGVPPADRNTLVVADSTVDPTKPLGEDDVSIRDPMLGFQTGRGRFNDDTPKYLSANGRIPSWLFPTTPEAEEARLLLQKVTIASYYRAIGTSPLGMGRSIAARFPTLNDFIKHYFVREFEQCDRDPDDESKRDEREQVAKYFNKGDLGIGREMHCIYRGCTAELACYVRNFAGVDPNDDKPTFDDMAGAEDALLAGRAFAIVAMVERGKMAERRLPNSVFFVVYDANGNLNTEGAQLDNKGFNTSIPGNCLQCHGIASSHSTRLSFSPFRFFRRHDVTNAMFLPFDLDAFEFFSTDPSDELSRAYQEPAFRAFNRMVLRTAIGRSEPARELIEGWYDGNLSDMADRTFRTFVGPDGWMTSDSVRNFFNTGQLYRKFFAVACRSCHISWADPESLKPGPLTFSTFADFRGLMPRTKTIMCGRADLPAEVAHKMPAAEQTLKVLWRSEGRQHFFAQAPDQVFGECAP